MPKRYISLLLTVISHMVLSEACPPALLELVGGVDGLCHRVPENYLRAIFGAYLGSRYVYRFGLETSPFDFFEFVQPYFDKIKASPSSSA